MEHSTNVKNYYEHNTHRFLWFQKNAATKSIHQPLWKEDSFTTKDAFLYSNKLILEQIIHHSSNAPLTIVDLGCGVGSTLFYLQEHFKSTAQYYGVTISATQVAIAIQHAKRLNQSPNIRFIEADFTNLPKKISNIDIAFSIEAFAHASNANKYFKQVSQKLNKGGKIILIDDCLNDNYDFDKLNKIDKQAVIDFKYGWIINSLKTVCELKEIAGQYSLRIIEDVDLTPYMRNNTLKHKWIKFLVTSFRWLYKVLPSKSYYFRSWIGGVGKQHCLKKGIVKYRKIVFEKL